MISADEILFGSLSVPITPTWCIFNPSMWRPHYKTLRKVCGVVRLRPRFHRLAKLRLYPSSSLSTSQPFGANRVLYPKLQEIASFATWDQNEGVGKDSVTGLNSCLRRMDGTWHYNIILGAQLCQPNAPTAKWREDIIPRNRKDECPRNNTLRHSNVAHATS